LNLEKGNFELEEVNYNKVVLYSPFTLKENFKLALIKEFGIKLDLNAFIERFSALFWNFIWYCSLMDLPYDFFLPYKKDNSAFGGKVNNHVEEKEKEILLTKHSSNSNYNCNISKLIITPGKFDNIVVISYSMHIAPSSEFTVMETGSKKSSGASSVINKNSADKLININHPLIKYSYSLKDLQISTDVVNISIFKNDNDSSGKDDYNCNQAVLDLENLNGPHSARHARMNSDSYIDPMRLADNINTIMSERNSLAMGDNYRNTPILSRGKFSYDSHHLNKVRLHHDFRKKFGKNNSMDINSKSSIIQFKDSNEEFAFYKEE
jgi:hypothetical protein